MGLNLAAVLKKSTTFLDIPAFKDKDTMFSELAEVFVREGLVSDKGQYIRALYEREEMGSTYMENGIAMPHGRCKAVTESGIIFCRFRESFVYPSNDETADVRYVFMIAVSAGTEDSNNEYLRLLGYIAAFLAHDEFLDIIANAGSYEEIIELSGALEVD